MSNNIEVQIIKLSRELEAARAAGDSDLEDNIQSEIYDLEDKLESLEEDEYNGKTHKARRWY